jgi:Leucine-rich repeat (LRR) protein
LILDCNQLTTIYSDSFGNIRNLKKFHLSNNKINSIDEEFIENTSIERLEMRGNICSNKNFPYTNKTELKEEFRVCYNNYRPREGSAVSMTKNQQF